MSYIAYINGLKIELSDSKPIAQTKQVNDLARLDNRQSNLTNKFIAPLTANNIRVMNRVYLVGNQSNVPYQKNVFDLFDADNGECLIYKGWANVTKSTSKGYEINAYDGIVDFYRLVENKSITDAGVNGLNHAKSLANIINSWNNISPYIYAIADFNGKNTYINSTGVEVGINIDYQIPSARVSYIWNKIFEFAGYTYSGTFFNNENFKNFFISFPKPVPTSVPNRILIYDDQCIPKHSTYYYFTEEGAYFNAESYLLTLPRENFANAYAFVDDIDTVTFITAGGFAYNQNAINILTAGTYSIDAFAPEIDFYWYHIKADGTPNLSGTAILDPTGTFKTHLFPCSVGDKIMFLINSDLFTLQTLQFDWKLNRIDGFIANFEEAFFDFKITAFVNEIMQHAGLTAFKDKYKNHIEFKSVDELLRTDSILDWSDKFQGRTSEVYKFGNYAKKNNFKYRYNEENENHNDSSIFIQDENLADEVTVLQSKIYSPEKNISLISGQRTPLFKIWNKEVKDDSTLQYKELTGRFYFMRFKFIAASALIGSETITDQQYVTQMAIADYEGLNFQSLLNTNYGSIKTILNKLKVLEIPFYLNSKDIANFDFKSLIFVEQLSSYFLVNKINSFIKNKVTKCEVIKVDYVKKLPVVVLPPNGTFIVLDSIAPDACELNFNFSSDVEFPVQIRVVGSANTFGGIPDPYLDSFDEVVTVNSFNFNISVLSGGFWSFRLELFLQPLINSNIVFVANLLTCVYVSPEPQNFITITGIKNVTIINNMRTIQIFFQTDFAFPLNIQLTSSSFGLIYGGFTQMFYNVDANYIEVQLQHLTEMTGPHNISVMLSSGGLSSTAVNSNIAISYP